MTTEDFIEFELNGSFLKNSGILGLLRLLEFKGAEAVKNVDYAVDGNSLRVSKEYFLNHNIGQIYLNAMVYYLGENTKFKNIMSKKSKIDSLIQKESRTKDEDKDLNNLINEFGDMLLKSSFVAGYEIINKYTDSAAPDISVIKKMKGKKNLEEKYSLYTDIYKTVENNDVQKILIFKEIMYSKINMFYDGVSYFQPANLKSDITECYNKEFVNPVIDEINSVKDGKKMCIECRRATNNVKAISFVNQTDDVNRKKSHYWNQKADAYVCPYCAFLYSMVPLGFYFTGKNAVFINVNTKISLLKGMMDKCSQLNKENNVQSEKSKIYRVFTSDAANMVINGVRNIQVVAKMKDVNEYDIKVISKDIVYGFKEAQENLHGRDGLLTRLEKVFIRTDSDYVSVYDMVMDSILNRKSLYYTFDYILINALKNSTNVNFLKCVLDLQFIFGGGKTMKKNLQEKTDIAFKHGIGVKQSITDSKIADKDNAMRGFVYRLENSLTTGAVEQFLDTIIRVYSSKGIAVPGVFKDMMKSEEYFNGIGRGYILGLMYEKYEANSTDNK